jgi:hypothetical protein
MAFKGDVVAVAINAFVALLFVGGSIGAIAQLSGPSTAPASPGPVEDVDKSEALAAPDCDRDDSSGPGSIDECRHEWREGWKERHEDRGRGHDKDDEDDEDD